MDIALAIAKSGLEAQHENLEVISNNLANASTPSFKKNRPEFEDLPYMSIKQPGSATSAETDTPTGLLLGSGTRLVSNPKIYTDGGLTETGRNMDVAIQGRGFYEVQLPNGAGMAYTRAGSFEINSQGQVTLSNGYILQPPITLPSQFSNLNVSEDGIVTVTVPGSNLPQQIGQLQLTDFVNPDGLQPIGGNLYLATSSSGSGTAANPGSNGFGNLKQFFVEGSNVNVVEEMVNLIEAQRAFEVTSKAVSSVDNMMADLAKST